MGNLSSIAGFTSAIGAVGGAAGAFSSSRSAKAGYEATAQIARNNATIAGWQADDALARGDRAVSLQRSKTRQIKGAQRAAMAANGVDLGTGSAANILADTEFFGEMDAATVAENANREAWALRSQSHNLTDEAAVMNARAAAESPLAAVSTSLLTSAGRVAERWYGTGGRGGNLSLGDGLSQGDRRKIGVY